MTNRQVGLLAVLIATSGYAGLPIFTRFIYDLSELQPTDIALWRFMVATPAIWLVIFLREFSGKKPAKQDTLPQVLRMTALGLFYTGATLTAFFGLKYIAASLYVVIFYTYPALVALISLFLGQKLRLIAWIALGLTLAGVVLTVPDLRLAGENTGLGLTIAIMNALVVAVYFVIISREMPKVSSVSRGSAYVITGTLLILILLIPFFGLRLPDNVATWGLLIALGTWSTAMPIFVINIGIQKLGVTQASIVGTAEPILTMILAMLILNESILPVQWMGAALIISGVILLEAYRGKPVKSA